MLLVEVEKPRGWKSPSLMPAVWVVWLVQGLAAEPMYQDGELLRGMDVLRSLDKARRVQDAELIMAFIADYEKKTGHLIR